MRGHRSASLPSPSVFLLEFSMYLYSYYNIVAYNFRNAMIWMLSFASSTITLLLCIFFFLSFFNLTYSRWTSSLPSRLWSHRIFPSLPGSRLTIFYRDGSLALLQLVNQWLNFTYSRSHAFRYERKNTNLTLVRIELTTSALAGVQVNY